ncbi:PIH1 domain-containing protein 2 [Esox lucius]|uniref:PIH1 domain-containing protein 2 n=1 Tax=Esox lucius TaxID=8010 RepID=A0A3P8Z0F3_ESOLU|nr:PIH1 domain-containing protein 2 [Esox lucius]XP_010890509.2 PIH1 domain-containing protein 2 [Esox lucius]
MSSLGCQVNIAAKDILQPVNQFWSMLDDLSQNDPQSYQMFMKKQMKQGADYFSPPQPDCCICTDLLEPKKGLLYINVCGWNCVPAPVNENKPVPVLGGRLETDTNEGGDSYSVVDVAFSPALLQQAQRDRMEKDQIHLLAMRFIQQQHGVCLSHRYTVSSWKLKGSLEDMHRRLASLKQQYPTTNTVSQTPASLLQQIASLHKEDSDDSTPVTFSTPDKHTSGPVEQSKKNLIQVISSTVTSQPQRPQHQLIVNSDASGHSRSLELSVDLPKVQSIAECHLSISQDDVLLEVLDLYHLHLVLPEAVNEESASATFNKKKQTLRLHVSIL